MCYFLWASVTLLRCKDQFFVLKWLPSCQLLLWGKCIGTYFSLEFFWNRGTGTFIGKDGTMWIVGGWSHTRRLKYHTTTEPPCIRYLSIVAGGMATQRSEFWRHNYGQIRRSEALSLFKRTNRCLHGRVAQIEYWSNKGKNDVVVSMKCRHSKERLHWGMSINVLQSFKVYVG